MNRSTLPIAAALLLLVAGCATTTPPITAYTDPDFAGRSYGRFVVAAELDDLEMRHRIETVLVEELRERGIEAEASARIFTPTRTWSAEQRTAELLRRGIDGRLAITLVSLWTRENHVPQTTTTTVTRESKEKSEKKGKEKEETGKEKETVTSTTQGGYTYSTEWGRYEIRLVDMASDRVAWIGVAALETSDASARRFRDDVVSQLQFDRMIAGTAE